MTLLEAVQAAIRRLHYSPRTEEAYLHWIRAFIRFHGGRHPREMGAPEATAFPNHLAVQPRTSASTQNQALCGTEYRAVTARVPTQLGRCLDLLDPSNVASAAPEEQQHVSDAPIGQDIGQRAELHLDGGEHALDRILAPGRDQRPREDIGDPGALGQSAGRVRVGAAHRGRSVDMHFSG